MPLYEFQCPACSHRFEKLQKLSAPDPQCPECGQSEARRYLGSSTTDTKVTSPTVPIVTEQPVVCQHVEVLHAHCAVGIAIPDDNALHQAILQTQTSTRYDLKLLDAREPQSHPVAGREPDTPVILGSLVGTIGMDQFLALDLPYINSLLIKYKQKEGPLQHLIKQLPQDQQSLLTEQDVHLYTTGSFYSLVLGHLYSYIGDELGGTGALDVVRPNEHYQFHDDPSRIVGVQIAKDSHKMSQWTPATCSPEEANKQLQEANGPNTHSQKPTLYLCETTWYSH